MGRTQGIKIEFNKCLQIIFITMTILSFSISKLRLENDKLWVVQSISTLVDCLEVQLKKLTVGQQTTCRKRLNPPKHPTLRHRFYFLQGGELHCSPRGSCVGFQDAQMQTTCLSFLQAMNLICKYPRGKVGIPCVQSQGLGNISVLVT